MLDRLDSYARGYHAAEAEMAGPIVVEREPAKVVKAPLSKKEKLAGRCAALKLRLEEEEQKQAEPESLDPIVQPDTPQPISFAEAARRLGRDVKLVRRRFMKMPGVIKIADVRKKGKRPYYNWSIPVALFNKVKDSWTVR